MAEGVLKVDVSSRLSRNLGLLHAGATVSIDLTTPAGQKQKFRTVFIGYLPKQYVLIQLPDASKLGNFSQYIKQNTAVTVRGVVEGHEGAIVAFVSKILQTIQIPSRIMVLAFPKEVRLHSLRSSIRIDTEITAKIQIDKEYWQATITNLSISGCQLDINNGESLVLTDDKVINIVIEDFHGVENIKLSAAICNIKQQNQGISFGVKFAAASKQQVTQLLHQAITIEE
jgi:hypothetical protein